MDRQWFWLRGEMERTKRPALLALARVVAEAGVPDAMIGGIALQVHRSEPRMPLDIDVAVATYGVLPHARLEAAGFSYTGQFSHSESWIGPEGTPVQFTDDPALAEAIPRAEEVELEDTRLRVIRRVDGTGTPAATEYDWWSVAIHEMGHCLGLDHESRITNPKPVMYPSLAAGEVRRTLTPDDSAGRDAIYSPALWALVPGGGSTPSAPAATVLQDNLALFVQGVDSRIYVNFPLTGPSSQPA